MLKIKDKVRVLRKGENNQPFVEVGQGVVKAVHVNNIGEDSFISYTDRDWPVEIEEILPINAECLKVVKF